MKAYMSEQHIYDVIHAHTHAEHIKIYIKYIVALITEMKMDTSYLSVVLRQTAQLNVEPNSNCLGKTVLHEFIFLIW